MSNQQTPTGHHILPPAARRKAATTLRWQCEDHLAAALAPFTSHGGLPLTRAVASMLQHRLRHIHRQYPGQIRSIEGWQRMHMVCLAEADRLAQTTCHLVALPDYNQHPGRNRDLCRRLARAILLGQIPDYVDGSLDLVFLPDLDLQADTRLACDGFLEVLEIGDIGFFCQPQIPERIKTDGAPSQDDHWQNATDHAIDSP